MTVPPYVVLEKAVGETPLACMEAWRDRAGIAASAPLTYAGRLDPMASGKLLVLVGDECKQKDEYLGLDKAYDFSVLLGIGSDSHDVLGRLETAETELLQSGVASVGALEAAKPSQPPADTTPSRAPLTNASSSVQETNLGQPAPEIHAATPNLGDAFQSQSDLVQSLELIAKDLEGDIELPYPHFSSKTVQGKPLHTWTLEGRLHEIEVPTKRSTIYSLKLNNIENCSKERPCYGSVGEN